MRAAVRSHAPSELYGAPRHDSCAAEPVQAEGEGAEYPAAAARGRSALAARVCPLFSTDTSRDRTRITTVCHETDLWENHR